MKKILCMYRKKPTESYYSDECMFVAQDAYSGGYPTRVDITRAHAFKTVTEAKNYAEMFKEDIYACEVVISITSFEL